MSSILNAVKRIVKSVVTAISTFAKKVAGCFRNDLVVGGVLAVIGYSVLFVPVVTHFVGTLLGYVFAIAISIAVVMVYFLCWWLIFWFLYQLIVRSWAWLMA